MSANHPLISILMQRQSCNNTDSYPIRLPCHSKSTCKVLCNYRHPHFSEVLTFCRRPPDRCAEHRILGCFGAQIRLWRQGWRARGFGVTGNQWIGRQKTRRASAGRVFSATEQSAGQLSLTACSRVLWKVMSGQRSCVKRRLTPEVAR